MRRARGSIVDGSTALTYMLQPLLVPRAKVMRARFYQYARALRNDMRAVWAACAQAFRSQAPREDVQGRYFTIYVDAKGVLVWRPIAI